MDRREPIRGIDFFINFYEAIPEERWCTDIFHDTMSGQCCAIGHLGVRDNFSKEKHELYNEIIKIIPVGIGHYTDTYPAELAKVNNGTHEKYQQETPKQRTLAYLKDIKNKKD